MKTKIAAAVALACLSSVAIAQQKTADAGPYAGISGGRSTATFTAQDYSVNSYATSFQTGAGTFSDTTDTHNTAWRIFLGYKFNQHWAIEGAYTSLGEAKYTLNGSGGVYAGGNAQFRIENNAWSLAAKGTLPVSKEFDVFALLGGTSNHSKMSMAATGAGFTTDLGTSYNTSRTRGYAMFGFGVEYKPTANIGIRGEYHNYGKFGSNITDATNNTGRTEPDAWLIGVSAKF